MLGTLTNTETNSYVEQYRVLHVKQKVMRDEIAEIDSKSKKIAFDLSTKQQSLQNYAHERESL